MTYMFLLREINELKVVRHLDRLTEETLSTNSYEKEQTSIGVVGLNNRSVLFAYKAKGDEDTESVLRFVKTYSSTNRNSITYLY
jgi:hypothetical protein